MRALLAKGRREGPRSFLKLFQRAAPGPGGEDRARPPKDGPALLATLRDALRPASVLDVGGGDGARGGRPECGDRAAAAADLPLRADLVVCLDLLARQADRAGYADLVDRLLRSADRALVVSGLERPPPALPAARFHEPLSATLRRADPGAEVYPLREEDGIVTFLALKAPPIRHPNDFGAEVLAGLIGRHPSPLRLVELRLAAWKTIGFFPRHEPRLWEYPAVADRMTALLPPGSRVVDVGAGVNPLVPYLASIGYALDTVDPSPLPRIWPPQPDWTEWEFLDYASCGLARRSWNCTLDRLPRSSTFDGAYSVSVIEHLPAAERRRLLREMRERLRHGGIAILTVDLRRGSDALWNRNRGLEIEEPASHGTLSDLLSELSRAGLERLEVECLRGWGQALVDTCLVVARRT